MFALIFLLKYAFPEKSYNPGTTYVSVSLKGLKLEKICIVFGVVKYVIRYQCCEHIFHHLCFASYLSC